MNKMDVHGEIVSGSPKTRKPTVVFCNDFFGRDGLGGNCWGAVACAMIIHEKLKKALRKCYFYSSKRRFFCKNGRFPGRHFCKWLMLCGLEKAEKENESAGQRSNSVCA
jgi:hypothetical protein